MRQSIRVLKQFRDKNLTLPIDITFIIFVKDLSFSKSILESLLAFPKFLIPYKHKSNSKSKNLIPYNTRIKIKRT